jgi:hypothetical protein
MQQPCAMGAMFGHLLQDLQEVDGAEEVSRRVFRYNHSLRRRILFRWRGGLTGRTQSGFFLLFLQTF